MSSLSIYIFHQTYNFDNRTIIYSILHKKNHSLKYPAFFAFHVFDSISYFPSRYYFSCYLLITFSSSMQTLKHEFQALHLNIVSCRRMLSNSEAIKLLTSLLVKSISFLPVGSLMTLSLYSQCHNSLFVNCYQA